MTQDPLQKMHRRAQKAEGELQKMREGLRVSAECAQKQVIAHPDLHHNFHWWLGWFLAHTPRYAALIDLHRAAVRAALQEKEAGE